MSPEQAVVALQALDTLGVGLLVCDSDMRIVHCDAAAERLLGARPEHLRDDGDPPRFQVLREDGTPWPLPERPLQSAVLRGQVTPSVVLGLRSTRATRWMRASARPLQTDGPPAVRRALHVHRRDRRRRCSGRPWSPRRAASGCSPSTAPTSSSDGGATGGASTSRRPPSTSSA